MGKRFASLRGLTAKDSTQRSFVKRGLRLWKQQPKQSPPFRKLSPPHQQTAALQLLEVTPIRQIAPLLNQQGRCICPDRLQNQSLPGRFCLACQDDAPYDSFPPFSHPRRKGGCGVPLAHGALSEGGSPPRPLTRGISPLIDAVSSRLGTAYYASRHERQRGDVGTLPQKGSLGNHSDHKFPIGATYRN